MQALLWGFPGFAAAFTMLLLIWHSHYIFFRRYALEDGWTTTLNAALLFLIIFFVYPLKYLATMLSGFVRSVAEGQPRSPMSFEDARDSLVYLSVGYAAVFLMFALLYMHAAAKRGRSRSLAHGARLHAFRLGPAMGACLDRRLGARWPPRCCRCNGRRSPASSTA